MNKNIITEEDIIKISHFFVYKNDSKIYVKDKEDLIGFIIYYLYLNKDKYDENRGSKSTFLYLYAKLAYRLYRLKKENKSFHKNNYIEDFINKDYNENYSTDILSSNDENFEKLENEELLEYYKKFLNNKEKTIFNYLINGYTQTEIAEMLNVSRQYISSFKMKIEKKIKKKIKKDLFG